VATVGFVTANVVGDFKGRCGAHLGSANERGLRSPARGIRRAVLANTAIDLRCGVVSPVPFETLFAAAKRAKGPPWTSGGIEFHLILRPLLPDEHTC
jgi:hypothetical protein